MPMPGQPVCATEVEAVEQLARLPAPPRMFFWTDAERKCPEGWGFIASVRQGVPPSGIEAELDAWADQYPKAWLAVDLRDGAIPPSTVQPLNDVLTGLKRPVIVIVSRSPEHEEWPQVRRFSIDRSVHALRCGIHRKGKTGPSHWVKS